MARLLLSALFILLAVLSWTTVLDTEASARTQQQLTQALATYGVARALNGIISVAQGTELAVQPVGVGITLAPGQILDPLNDLIERFSWLVLVACASLGTQLLLGELFAQSWIAGGFGLISCGLIIFVWAPPNKFQRPLLKLLATAVFIRFLVTFVMLGNAWVSDLMLRDRQESAVQVLNHLSSDLRNTETVVIDPDENTSLLQRLQTLIATGKETLDLPRALKELQDKAESAINELINLMVVLTVETLILPLLTILLAFGALKWFWRTLGDQH